MWCRVDVAVQSAIWFLPTLTTLALLEVPAEFALGVSKAQSMQSHTTLDKATWMVVWYYDSSRGGPRVPEASESLLA